MRRIVILKGTPIGMRDRSFIAITDKSVVYGPDHSTISTWLCINDDTPVSRFGLSSIDAQCELEFLAMVIGLTDPG